MAAAGASSSMAASGTQAHQQLDVAAVEETFKRLQSHRGVLGVMAVNADGIAVRSTLPDNEATVAYAALASGFTARARAAVRALDPADELRFVRIRSSKHEIMIAPEFERGREYALLVVQDPVTD